MAYARRMSKVHRSFIREILKVTQDPSIISFAGGLPNPAFFPSEELAEAAAAELRESGKSALQYATTEGYQPLREFIAARYREKAGLIVDPATIIVTTGSQQGLDLVGKAFIDPGDKVVLERPGYLGAIQAFSFFEPEFKSVELQNDGIDTEALAAAADGAKLFYTVPNFQNPSGISYSLEKRRQTADILSRTGTVLVEDNPYGELRFLGRDLPPITSFCTGRTVLLGSFSKIAAPGLRIGWLCTDPETHDLLVRAKQASDLHTSTMTQRVLHRYLTTNDLDRHIDAIRTAYGKQRDNMVAAVKAHFPPEVRTTEPEGGMFLWLTLPEGFSAMELFKLAIARQVAFVPGTPFYVDGGGANTLRLNFSNSDAARIEEGVSRLAQCYREYAAGKRAA